MRRILTKNEKKIISLFKKIDEIARSEDVKMYVFGQAGYNFYLLDRTQKYYDFENKKSCIASERILFESKNLQGDGGDADFRSAKVK